MNRPFFVGISIALFVGFIVLINSVFIVTLREQALVIRFGEITSMHNVYGDEDGAGLKLKVPFIENVVYLDRRNLELDASPREITAADQQRLEVDAFVRWRISEPIRFYQSLNNVTTARLRLETILNTSLREVLGTVDSTDIISGQRAELMQRIQQRLTRSVQEAKLGIEIIDVRVRRVELPIENRDNVFLRMIAERNQEAAGIRAEGQEEANKLRAASDREARVIVAQATEQSEKIKGEGDAQRNKIYAEAYGLDPDFFAFQRSMLAYEESIKPGTVMVISPDSEFFRFMENQRGTR
jgi:modulator of FtsH protease HflC